MLTDFSVSRSALDWSGQEVGSSRRRSSRLESEVADAAAEQADEAVDRPRFGPTGHGGGALRVLALRRAPHARSLSAVFDGPDAVSPLHEQDGSRTVVKAPTSTFVLGTGAYSLVLVVLAFLSAGSGHGVFFPMRIFFAPISGVFVLVDNAEVALGVLLLAAF